MILRLQAHLYKISDRIPCHICYETQPHARSFSHTVLSILLSISHICDEVWDYKFGAKIQSSSEYRKVSQTLPEVLFCSFFFPFVFSFSQIVFVLLVIIQHIMRLSCVPIKSYP